MDFSLILFVALVVTGGIILLYRFFARDEAAADSPEADEQPKQPIVLEYARALFPVILIVFVLRSFIVEPFRIPSGSMLPNLHVGDFILVNKFKYGIRLPLVHLRVLPLGLPERGDVMVFRYPKNQKLNFIKRVVGLPGDRLSYVGRRLSVNGVAVDLEPDGEFIYPQDKAGDRGLPQWIEHIGDQNHRILIDRATRSGNLPDVRVPEGHYFVMGDNRDHSNDSRIWGFVPEDHIVGEAFFIWFSWKSLSGGGVAWARIGNSID